MTMIKPPCKDCEERHTLCWGECERYAEYKRALEEMNEHRRRDRDVLEYVHDRQRKADRMDTMNYTKRGRKSIEKGAIY